MELLAAAGISSCAGAQQQQQGCVLCQQLQKQYVLAAAEVRMGVYLQSATAAAAAGTRSSCSSNTSWQLLKYAGVCDARGLSLLGDTARPAAGPGAAQRCYRVKLQ
jgi:hypothetical protein